MRKFILFIISFLFVGSVFAQAPGAAEKNAANIPLKAKNYQEAFPLLEKYLEVVEYNDKEYVYNTAIAALQIKNYDAAKKYYDMSIKNNYKVPESYFGKARAEENLKDNAAMLATLEAGMKAVPGNARLETKYGTYYINLGSEEQKRGNVSKAAEAFNKALTINNDGLKSRAYYQLGSLYYNNGAKILGDASPYANTEKERYEVEKTKANAELKKALDYANQAKAIDAGNEGVAQLIKQIQETMK